MEDTENFKIPQRRLEDAKQVFHMFIKKDDSLALTNEMGALFKALGLALKPDQQELWAEELDNGEGFFDFDALLGVLRQKILADMEEKELKEAFRALDVKNEGEIDVEDLRIILRAMGDDLTEEDIQDMIDETDTDGSGLVDYDEFYALMMG